MSVTVPALIPVAGSREAAEAVIEAIVNVKQHAQAQLTAVRTMHAEQLAAAKRQAEAERAALQTAHEKAIADLIAKTTAESDDLKRQLAEVRNAAAELPTLRQRLQSCAYASQVLAAAVQ
jgi:hypothetical protein